MKYRSSHSVRWPRSAIFSKNHNYLLQITAVFYKPQFFSTIWWLLSTNHNFFLQYCNFFLQIATFCHKSLLFSTDHNLFYTILNLFIHYYNFFEQILTCFHKNSNFFLHFRKLFFHKYQLFSAISQLFSTEGMSESLVWINEKSVTSFTTRRRWPMRSELEKWKMRNSFAK